MSLFIWAIFPPEKYADLIECPHFYSGHEM